MLKKSLILFLFYSLISSILYCNEMIKINGDLRLRFQRDDAGNYYRDRTRMRLRLKGKADVNENLMVGFGLATGSNDLRSTNQTLEGTFSTKSINIDYAYAKYICLKSGITQFYGKFSNKLLIWKPSDLLWDSDINVEGIRINKVLKGNNIDIFINAGYLVLDHVKTEGNPSMLVFQPGLVFKLSDTSKLKLAGSVYNFDKLNDAYLGSVTDGFISGSNSLDLSGDLKYDYNCISLGTEIGFEDLICQKKLILFVEGVLNPDPDEQNQGFLGGIKFGSNKVKNCGDWELKAMYRELQKDAWIELFPDSDALDGKTDNQGIEAILKYGLTKNTYFSVDYYYMGNVGEDNNKSLTQFDIGIKF